MHGSIVHTILLKKVVQQQVQKKKEMDHLMGRNGITSSFTFEVLFLSYFQCNMGLQSSPFSKKLSLTWLPRGFFLTIHPYVIPTLIL